MATASAAPTDARPALLRVTASDGVPIAAARAGQGPPLLLVHGTTSERSRWLPVLAVLAETRTVYGMDRRGRGDSGDAEAYAIAQEYADVAAVVAAIGGTVDVVAHSFGAICALEATLLTGAIGRLVLYEPPVPTPGLADSTDETRVDAIAALIASGEPEAALVGFYRDVLRAPEAEIARLRTQDNWAQRLALAHTIPRELRAVRRYRFDPARFAAMHRPVRLLVGGDSPPRYQASTAALQAGLRGATTAVLDGQQHNAINMAPAAFLAAVTGFLGR